MKGIVHGATGRVGGRAVGEASGRGHEITAVTCAPWRWWMSVSDR